MNEDILAQKIHACWLGKNIGGTLGGPHEGRAEPLDLEFYDPVPTSVMANDDLDLQVVWLHHLLSGSHHTVTPELMAAAWRRHVFFPFDEYAVARRNHELGLRGPDQGSFDNYFGHGMGAAIRSEIWACVAPGEPERAAGFAWADAVVDHSGEGVWAEVFHAALQSAAFVDSDRDRLMSTALRLLPGDCVLKQALEQTVAWWREKQEWKSVRAMIVDAYGTPNFTDVVANLCFEVLGWYAGAGDFGRSICIAVNCGLDTDCTGATLGALLGIIDPKCIPARWRDPIGEQVVISPQIVDVSVPADLAELTRRTLRLRAQLADARPSLGQIRPRVPPRLGEQASFSLRFEEASWPSADVIRRVPAPVVSNWKAGEAGGHWWHLNADDFAGGAKLFRFRFRVEQPHPVKLMVYYLPGVRAWVDGRNVITLTPPDLSSDPFIAPSFHRANKSAFTFDSSRLGFGMHELIIACVRPPSHKPADLVFGLADAVTNFWLPNAFRTDPA